MTAFPSGCRAFLRELPTHLVAARSSQAVPHANDCRSCAQRLAAAVRQDGLLRRLGAPVPPAALRSALFLSAIHERVVAECEASELGRQLERVLVAMPAPAATPWPAQVLPASARAAVDRPPAASSELWSVVRSQVLAEIHGRQLRFRRRFFLASAAAAVLLVGTLLPLFSLNDGTSEAPEPVLVRVDSPPPGADFISPGLALQEAVLR